MVSKKPNRNQLKHFVTLWNYTDETIINGAKKKNYQKSYLKYVHYEFKRASNILMSGSSNADSLFLMLFNGVSIVTSEDGIIRSFVPSHIFLSQTPEDRNNMYTLNDGNDFIALEFVDGDISTCGEKERKDYKLNVVTPKYGANTEIHHWEVYGS